MSNLPHFLRSCLNGSADDSASSGGPGSGLDFKSSRDNLYAFGKLWASVGMVFYRLNLVKG